MKNASIFDIFLEAALYMKIPSSSIGKGNLVAEEFYIIDFALLDNLLGISLSDS